VLSACAAGPPIPSLLPLLTTLLLCTRHSSSPDIAQVSQSISWGMGTRDREGGHYSASWAMVIAIEIVSVRAGDHATGRAADRDRVRALHRTWNRALCRGRSHALGRALCRALCRVICCALCPAIAIATSASASASVSPMRTERQRKSGSGDAFGAFPFVFVFPFSGLSLCLCVCVCVCVCPLRRRSPQPTRPMQPLRRRAVRSALSSVHPLSQCHCCSSTRRLLPPPTPFSFARNSYIERSGDLQNTCVHTAQRRRVSGHHRRWAQWTGQVSAAAVPVPPHRLQTPRAVTECFEPVSRDNTSAARSSAD
jgi:hypothetical protein